MIYTLAYILMGKIYYDFSKLFQNIFSLPLQLFQDVDKLLRNVRLLELYQITYGQSKLVFRDFIDSMPYPTYHFSQKFLMVVVVTCAN